MSLSSGMRLGPYEILNVIGAGGMGEVYRARDTRLDRDVAIKVLPEWNDMAGQSGRSNRHAELPHTLSFTDEVTSLIDHPVQAIRRQLLD